MVSAIIVAAGGSTRMGTGDSKQFIPLCGKPAISYTLAAFQACALIDEIVVVSRAQDIDRIAQLAKENGVDKLGKVVEGGSCRAESVQNGILAANEDAQFFAIHDGARPLITPQEITDVVKAALETGAATLGTSVTDTIKSADETNTIVSTPDRATLRAVQTPQVFEKDLYTLALSEAKDLQSVTDDCSLIENMGGEVLIVEGSRENIKLTTPIDVVLAERILETRGEA